MFLDAVHITNKFAQHGDTLITSVTNMPEQMDVRVTNFPESISLSKDVSVLRDSIDSISAHVTRIFNEGIGYPDSVQIWAIPLIIAILVMAMPLLLQFVNGLDQKYHATKVTYEFKHHWIYISFWIMLSLSVVSISIWVILFMYLEKSPKYVDILLVSVAFLFLFSILLLIIRLMVFSSPKALKKYMEIVLKENLSSSAQ